ncbi:MAG: AAA domain-containing protein [Bacteroidaceae bacterium]|nr:AAA domain-containing protein [Bacteroidaceae bacterium]
MALRVFKISAYDHMAETQQFEAIRDLLTQQFGDSEEECLLIGNYNIEGVELDALLITQGGVRILEFKNWGGRIVARENGTWTANGMTVEGGAGRKSPYEQARLNRSRVAKGMMRMCNLPPQAISACILFRRECEIDDRQLSDTVKTWLTITDNPHLNRILDNMGQPWLTADAIKAMPQQMHIEEFDAANQHEGDETAENYDPEASVSLFAELQGSLKHLPHHLKMYNHMNRVFMKCLEQQTANNRLNLGGTFAKTDYLLKEHGASHSLVRMTNDTRVRLRRRSELKEEELAKWHLFDLRNLAKFMSLIYHTPIPATLVEAFPTEREETYVPTLVGEKMRLIVEKWDECFVYGAPEEMVDGETVKVCYAKGNKIYDYDWTYLSAMFFKGAQLNLIRPREKEGIVYPELIIFEPDYLVDISTIARCFTNYAESPFVNLINKIQASESSVPIELGNFAGQLLDEQIHQLPNTRSYKDSIMEYFQHNAIGLLTVGIDSSFHNDAQMQKTHIAHAIGEVLPQSVSSFDPTEGMVEPSFFSEMLGVQGRMDYLQLDYKVLLEQKSGKGEFPYDNFIKPKYKEEHYVQMLLYMMLIRYNFRETYERNKQELSAFLLYSKYEESLLGLGFAPELIFRAIKVRNGLAWTEMQYTQPNGFRLLDTLTPEKLNMKHVDNNLWTRFQSDQIAKLLAPLQQASELEKAYYHRFMTFIANEHMLSKLGNKTKENSGFASKWYDTLEEKLQAGNIYDRLQLALSDSDSKGSVRRVPLRFTQRMNSDMTNFRVGDIVILYAYNPNEEPDARRTMVFRGSIEDIDTEKVVVVLRAAQSDAKVFLREKGKMWAIEHDFMESSYGSLYRGMHAFLSAPKPRRDLWLMQREPEVDETRLINGDYGYFNELSTRVKRAKDLFLIIGPPGTGKTSFGLLNTLKEELTEAGSSVLLLSFTNRAVDEICSKLHKDGIDFIRIGGGLTCSPEYRDKLLNQKAQNCSNLEQLRHSIMDTRVFVATTTSMNAHIALFQLKQFSLAIIDEASQILEPHLISIISAHHNGVPAIQKMVLIGDHKQLPAVVQQKQEVSRVQDSLLLDIHLSDCRLSLFERLLKWFRKPDGKYDERFVYMLTKQGRMHHDIASFPNYTFYQNQLQEVPLEHQQTPLPCHGRGKHGIDDLLLTRRIAFVHADAPTEPISDKVNQVEADIIAATVLRIYEREKDDFKVEETVGVIVPYRNQIATVRNTIDRAGIKVLHDITIDTVERYQGSQRKYIIYGFTIQQYYQLNFLTNNTFTDWDGSQIDRKLNVAMTRAEEHLIMVGNTGLLCNNFTFYKLIEFIRSRHGYFNVPMEQYVKGAFDVPMYEPKPIDMSQASYSTTPLFEKTFDQWVTEPLKLASGEGWPERVLGHDMCTNLNAIGYGRIRLHKHSQMNHEVQTTAHEQVQLYAYYMMRERYCSSRQVYDSCQEWLRSHIEATRGRVHMIDIGCGTATSMLAFAELFLKDAPNMVCTGIDTSTEMQHLGMQFMDGMFGKRIHYQMLDAFTSLGKSFWQGCSELPSLVIFNLAYFFSNVTTHFAEQLARQILTAMKEHPLNQYVLIMQQSEADVNLNAYKAFSMVLSPHTQTFKDEHATMPYTLEKDEHALPFCYTIQMG